MTVGYYQLGHDNKNCFVNICPLVGSKTLKNVQQGWLFRPVADGELILWGLKALRRTVSREAGAQHDHWMRYQKKSKTRGVKPGDLH